MDLCFLCEMKKYPKEKLLDEKFLYERKEEFYPTEEFGDFARVCESCNIEVLIYYFDK